MIIHSTCACYCLISPVKRHRQRNVINSSDFFLWVSFLQFTRCFSFNTHTVGLDERGYFYFVGGAIINQLLRGCDRKMASCFQDCNSLINSFIESEWIGTFWSSYCFCEQLRRQIHHQFKQPSWDFNGRCRTKYITDEFPSPQLLICTIFPPQQNFLSSTI